MRIVALINQKGGVGKTTTSANLGGGLARLGNKVLLIDIDPQANLSLHLNIDPHKVSKTIYDVLVGNARFDEVVQPTAEPGLFLVPSHIDLCSAELELVSTVGREVVLRDALKQYIDQQEEPFDYIFIDCPPSLGLLSLNSLAAVEEVIIPIQAEFFALQGMGKLVEVVNLVRDRLNASLRISGIVTCMYRAQTTLAKEVLKEVQSYFGTIVFKSKIRQNIKLAEAPGHGKTIFEYDPGSNGARDYMELACEVAGESANRSQEEEEPEINTEPSASEGNDTLVVTPSPVESQPDSKASHLDEKSPEDSLSEPPQVVNPQSSEGIPPADEPLPPEGMSEAY